MRERIPALCRLRMGLVLLVCALAVHARLADAAGALFTEEPIVRSSPAIGSDIYDLFGYAAAFHRVNDMGDKSDFNHAISNTKIIVGSPNGTFPGGLSFSGVNDSQVVNNTGLVYMCPITPGDCESLSGNEMGNDIRLFDYEDNELMADAVDASNNIVRIVPNEEKNGQFMGATIVSTGDHFMVCAPRWIGLVTNRFGAFDKTRAHGRCFYSDRSLSNFTILRPCTVGSSQNPSGESFCMAGTAASLYETESPSNFSVFMGTPPFDNSNGAVVEYEITAGGNSLPTFIPRKDTTNQFWYTGLSVSLGRITDSIEKDLIYSLPKKNNYRGSVDVYSLRDRDVLAELNGRQMGEYFGWVVITADLNGDGYDEILVGAPLYSESDGIEKGRVFIFKNNGTLDAQDPIILTRPVAKGRFGSAIANLGDINSDGFEDVAIGAPFEDQGDAEGTVYVFLGDGDTYIDTEPHQIIRADDLSAGLGLQGESSLQTFGYSLASGVDVDANEYNDLVIGGYKSQVVVVLRTQSIANVTISPYTDTPQLEYNIQNCPIGDEVFACFNLLINASFSGRGLSEQSLSTIVSVREEVSQAQNMEQRLFFLDSDRNMTDSFEGVLDFEMTNVEEQKNITVYVKNNIEDRRTDLNFTVTVTEQEYPSRSVNGSQDVIDLRERPIINVLPLNNIQLQLPLAGCDGICMPNLELELNETRYIDSDGKAADVDEVIAGRITELQFVLDYRTLDDDAADAILRLNLPSNILDTSNIRIDSNLVGRQTKLPNSHCTDVICNLQSIFSDYDGIHQVVITVPVLGSVVGNEVDGVALFTIEALEDPSTGNNMASVSLSVSARADVNIINMIATPNVTQYEDADDLGQRIIIRTTIINSGPSTIPSSKLVVYLPGKPPGSEFYYIYPSSLGNTLTTTGVTCTGLNPDGLITASSGNRRRKRMSEKPVLERLRRLVKGKSETRSIQKRAITQTVNCGVTPESCTAITCTITNLPRSSSLPISIHTNVDHRFYRTQNGDFQFNAHSVFQVTSDFIVGNNQAEITSNKFLVQEVKAGEDKPIPIWVYVVSIVGALIVLVLIIFLLYLVGFFRLRRKERITKEKERMVSHSAGVTASTTAGATVDLDSKPEEDDNLDSKPFHDSPDAEDVNEPDETEL